MTTVPIMSSQLDAALHRLQKHGQVQLDSDGYYRVLDKWWSISGSQMRKLVVLGHARIDKVGASTVAVYVGRRE